MKNIALIANTTGLTVVVGSTVTSIASDHPNIDAIKDAYAAGDADELERLISIRKTLADIGGGLVRIDRGSLYYGDRKLTNGLARRIIKLMNEGKDGFAKPLIAFMENLLLNPSYRAVEGLYEWLEKSNLPITPDGHFIAWKIVGPTYRDLRTGSFDNSVGKIVEVSRNEVDENPDKTCSYGLHFCSNEYLPHYGNASGNRIVMVKVNPKDVGAFPHDYNISKGRCCRYEVVGEVTREETATKFANLKSGVYHGTINRKTVKKLDTTGSRGEVILKFTDGTEQRTKNRIGNTTSFEQKGDVVTLLPSGRTINIG